MTRLIYVHWVEIGYQVVGVREQEPAELLFCESPEELGMVLRQWGVAQMGVSLLFTQLAKSPDAQLKL
jgi:hypothetical protein